MLVSMNCSSSEKKDVAYHSCRVDQVHNIHHDSNAQLFFLLSLMDDLPRDSRSLAAMSRDRKPTWYSTHVWVTLRPHFSDPRVSATMQHRRGRGLILGLVLQWGIDRIFFTLVSLSFLNGDTGGFVSR